MSEVRLLLAAIQYFTRIRVPAGIGHEPQQLAGALRYFPAIGWLVGAIAALALWLTAQILPAPLPVIMSTAVAVLMTGAMHEDGLADAFDGFGGGATRERALEIMKDPRLGTYGAVALVLALLLKIATLSAMPTLLAMTALVAAHAYSRFCAVVVVFKGIYVGNVERSRAAPLLASMSRSEVGIAALFGVAPVMLCGVRGLAAGLLALAVAWLMHTWCIRRLGGYTGDTLGAVQQLSEASFYLALIAGWR